MTTQHASISPGLAALQLPSLDGLTEQQVRGVTCVWDGIVLTPETAVDLGPRPQRRLDGHYQWFPRACLGCVSERALAALHDHCVNCDQCSQKVPGHACTTGAELQRLVMRRGR